MKRGQHRGEPADTIVRYEPGIDGETLLMDRASAALHLGVSERTVRRRCQPVACDVATRTPLYDEQDTAAACTNVRARPGGTIAARRARTAARFQLVL